MRAYDIIKTKRDGGVLTDAEISYFINGYTKGDIPDYQAAAWLMAVYERGMTSAETAALTRAMANSGDSIDLSGIRGPKADKHSTGGVGDKTTLITAPIVAACGVKVAKMSGRGLGHTGGTTDKLLSIPGMRVDFDRDEFVSIVNRYGICVTGSTADLAPADKKLYALRDVTATVDSIPLIAASIMSKKIASGSKNLVLDVKVGSGAFMKNEKAAGRLANEMVNIGTSAGLKVTALLTNMNSPLGYAIGNSLEVIEAVNTLKGTGPEDLTELCLTLAAHMLHLAGKGDIGECEEAARNALYSGLAYERFCWMVNAQGGDVGVIMDTSLFKKAKYYRTLTAQVSGYVSGINAELCGRAAVLLGAGRSKKEDDIDMAAGVMIETKPGAFIKSGDVVATMYSEHEELFDGANSELASAFSISPDEVAPSRLIIREISNAD
ncbi:MAG: thymidine phosphorylase [Clostridiales bacterium]|nr:thymidine phosphorylase [Clostridiales bacterium]